MITLDVNKKGLDVILSNNNLTVKIPKDGINQYILATQGYNKGKKYFEVYISETSITIGIGVIPINTNNILYDGYNLYQYTGNVYHNNSGTSYASAIPNNSTIGVAIDYDNHQMSYYLNGKSLGVAFTNLPNEILYPVISNLGLDEAGATINFGSKPFKYNMPSDYSSYDVSYKYFIKHNNQYYTLKPDFYKEGKFSPLTLTGGSQPNNTDYENFGFNDINLLVQDVTVGIETFRPIDKLENEFDIVMSKE